MRINRYIARSGVASRRKAEALITGGLVYVNEEKITDLTYNVNELKDCVKVDGKKISLPDYKYLLLSKPKGYTVTRKDPHAEKTIYELLPSDNSLLAVGRLDKDTEGLLLLTNDGDFAQNIIHPSKKIEKEYLVKMTLPICDDAIKKLTSGVKLSDGMAKAKSVKKINQKYISIVIEEGRNRIVRRMIEAIGNEVTHLYRRRIGEIVCDVPIGEYRMLTEKEIVLYAK